MTQRWPLHPTPGHGEALTSWLHRLATRYGMDLDQLVRHDLTPPGAPAPGSTGSLDLDAPSELITILAARTGVPVEQVRRMTIAGWVPWLLDSLQPEPVPGGAFDTYVRQDSVLVTSKEHPDREVTNWRAWLPLNSKNRPVSRVCPVCVESTTDGSLTFPLIMQLPITLTCPRHGCRLDAAFGSYAFFGWEHSKTNDRPAPRQVVIQDARTEQALRIGTVALPRRTVHVGVWFRLLRTLIEELSIPLSKLRTRPRRSIELIWRKVGHPARAGIVGAARTYETLPWPQQEMYLEAAATAIHLVETGEIEARGTLGHLLTPEPDRPAHDGLPPRDIWDEAREAMTEALTLAQQDPLAAEHMLAILTSLTRTEKTFRGIRGDLIDLDVPEAFLPPTLAAMRSRRTSPGLSHNSPVAIVHKT
ncbi:TniQ family protein [uncultured Microbacterium sp.]|uniref:TniQ family protein n=1 Tax=uncultured Microbacterium sp. TaxID=191216 RepID=UPI002624E169|nr:TniQ family protein [uncultured Microbacterium sp.]